MQASAKVGIGRLMLLMLAAVLAAVALLPSFVSAATLTDADELGRFGERGTGAGQLSFSRPRAADPVTGHLYVTDGNSRIDEFTPWGEFVKAFGWDVAPGAVNEQQEVRVRAGAGTFKLSFGASTTVDLSFDATEPEVQSALNALASIGGAGGSVTVTEQLGNPSTATPFIYVVAFKGSLAGKDVAQLSATSGSTPLSAGNPKTELEVRTRADGTPGGTGLESCTAESGCQAGSKGPGAGQFLGPKWLVVDSSGDLYVGEFFDNSGLQNSRIQKFSPTGHFLWMIGGDTIVDGAAGTGIVTPGSKTITSVITTEKVFRVGQAIEGTGIETGTTIAKVGNGTIELSRAAGPAATGTTTNLNVAPGPNNVSSNKVETVKLGANTTGGSFKLFFRIPDPSRSEATTEPIPYNASAAELQSILTALPNIGAGNVAVTGSPGGPWAVEFEGARFADTDVEWFYAGLAEAERQKEASGLTVSSGEKEVNVSASKGAETCSVAAECQAPGIGETGAGQFYLSPIVALAPDGSLLVASDKRIQRFNAAGAYQSTLELSKEPQAVAVAPGSGDLYVVYREGGGVHQLDPTSGQELANLEVERPQGSLATDPEGDVFVAARHADPGDAEYAGDGIGPFDRVIEFDAKGNRVSVLAESELYLNESNRPQRYFLEGIGTNALGDLYASYVTEGGTANFIRFFGPPPVSYESPPRHPPQIAAQYATSVSAGEAEVKAKINPRFWNDTSFHLEYGAAPCSEGGCAETEALRLTSRVAGSPLTSPGVLLEGLEAGTAYHYRFVAESTGGGPVYGPDATFTTYRSPVAPSCPGNEAFRGGASANLPDCRAYEMVSPLDKEGGDVAVQVGGPALLPSALEQAATSGEKLAYGSYRSFGGAESAPYTTQYVASRREGEGWESHAISPPRGRALTNVLNQGKPEFRAFSLDLCEGWLQSYAEPPLAPEAPAGIVDLYRRADEECGGPSYEALNTTAVPKGLETELQGVSEDGSTAVFRADRALAAGGGQGHAQLYGAGGGSERFLCVLPGGGAFAKSCTAGALWALTEDLLDSEENQVSNALSADGSRVYWTASGATLSGGPLYLRQNPMAPQSALAHGGATGTGTLKEGSATVTALVAAKGKATITTGSTTATLTEAPSVGAFVAGQPLNTVSGIEAGTKVLSCSPACGPSAETLTLSKAATQSKEVTLTSKGPMPFATGQTIAGPGIPLGTTIATAKEGELTLSKAASANQTGAALEAFSECTEAEKACTLPVSAKAEAEAGTSTSQFWAASEDGSVAIFSTGGLSEGKARLYEYRAGDRSTHLIAGKVRGVMGVSEDASRAYLASEEDLDEAGPAIAGEPNLYLYEAGEGAGAGSFRFVATLGSRDLTLDAGPTYSPIAGNLTAHEARVAPDGQSAAFAAYAPLTGYDNTDRGSGEADAELFVYDARANEGKGRLVCASCNPSGARPAGQEFSRVASSNSDPWTAARIPVPENVLYASRVLADNGRRLFFDSYDALVPRDTNGREDVYQWEAPGEGSCEESSPTYSPRNQGCVDLISSGKSTLDSKFLDASPTGEDVFFATVSSLIPADTGLQDVYDARVGGGLPEPPPPAALCEGEACQSAPEAPNDPTPASESFKGAGNVHEEGPVTRKPCAKGKVRRHGRCVAKHKAKKRAKRNRRAGR